MSGWICVCSEESGGNQVSFKLQNRKPKNHAKEFKVLGREHAP